MLYPKKNLIPPFTSDRWFNDSTIAGGTLTPDLFNDYRAVFNITVSGQGRLVHIPVEIGKTYIFSYGIMSGLYRIYKRKVTYHIDNLWIAKNGEAFTVDSSFEGFITLRLTNSALGNSVYENMQLEEGTVKTDFERLKMINKPAILPKDVITSDMTGAASHPYVALNVFSIKKDVRLKTSKISALTTGTFKVMVQEWKDGVGLVGNPIYKDDKVISAVGEYTYDFGGLLLKAGKTYVIGRYEQTDGAAVKRTTSANIGTLKYVTWLGGTTPSQTSVIYPTTYYYFYGLVFERPVQDEPTLFPKKNYILPFTQWSADSKAGAVFEELTDRKMRVTFNSTAQYIGVNMPFDVSALKALRGKTVTVSVKNANRFRLNNTQVQLRFTGQSGQSDFVLGSTDGGYQEVTKVVPYDFNSGFVKIQTNVVGAGAKIEVEDLQLEIADKATPYEPYTLSNKTPVLVPKKNTVPLNPTLSSAGSVSISQSNPYSFVIDWTQAFDAYIKDIPVKPNKVYTISFKKTAISNDVSVTVRDKNNVSLTSPLQTTSITLNVGSVDSLTLRFARTDTAQSTGRVLIDELQVEEGSVKTPFEPYKGINKPAVLYPQKNLLNPKAWVNGRIFDTAFKATGGIRVEGDSLIVVSSVNSFGSQIVDVKPNTDYTISHAVTENQGIYIYTLSGTDLRIADRASPVTVNSGNNRQLIIGFYKSGSANNVPEMRFDKPMMIEGATEAAFEPYILGNKPL